MKEIALTRNMVALVDDKDYERVVSAGKWRALPSNQTFYAARHVQVNGKAKTEYLHRLVLHLTNPLQTADHKNGNGLDNRRHNLRVCTNRRNQRNAKKRMNGKPSSSQFKGVSFNKATGKWRANIQFEGKKIHLGWFVHEVDAAHCYDAAARLHFGDMPAATSLTTARFRLCELTSCLSSASGGNTLQVVDKEMVGSAGLEPATSCL